MVILTKYHSPVTGDFSAGTVNVSVVANVCGDAVCDPGEDCSGCPADCGVCPSPTPTPAASPGGGGGGSGGPSGPVTYMLDFEIKDRYEFYASEGDKVNVIWPGDKFYRYEIKNITGNGRYLKLGFLDYELEYDVERGEVAYFDLDSDERDDLSVYYSSSGFLIWIRLRDELGEAVSLPGFHKEKVSEEEGFTFPKIVYPSTIAGLVLVVFIIVLLIFVLQHFRIKGVEKTQSGKLERLHKKYLKSKKRVGARSAYKEKLRRQKDVLKRAYAEGHVKKNTYKSSLSRINRYLGNAG